MYRMWSGFCSAGAVSAALLLAGCGAPQDTNVRVVNASPGLTGGAVQVGVIGVVGGLPYGTEGIDQEGQYSGPPDSSGDYRPVGAGLNQNILVYTQTPVSPLAKQTQTLVQNDFYTVVALGASPNVGILTLTDDDSAPQSGDFKWRIVDTSGDAGPVDIYLTAPGASLSGATPVVSNMAFGQYTSYFQIKPGAYVVQVTQHGNTVSALFTAAFSPAGNSIYTTYFLDPPTSGSTNYGLLTTNDPVAVTTAPAKP